MLRLAAISGVFTGSWKPSAGRHAPGSYSPRLATHVRPPHFLPPGRRVSVQLAQGPVYRGAVRRHLGWLAAARDRDREAANLLLNLDHVAVITQEPSGEEPGGHLEALPKETLPSRPRQSVQTRVSRAPGRAWKDDDLRTLADAFLDGGEDVDLAGRFNRSRGQIKELRQGFECARGIS